MTGKGGKTPSHEEVMPDSNTTGPERITQHRFRLESLAFSFLLLISILSFDHWLDSVPNRHEFGSRTADLRFAPIDLGGDRWPFQLAGAWEVTSTDPCLGGISGLAEVEGSLLALSDSGVLIRFAPPSGPSARADIRELPDGPGSARYKRNRDSEAISRDPGGRGWWIAFENHHQLWLYDSRFNRVLDRVDLRPIGWRANKGVEGIAADRNQLLIFPEAGDALVGIIGSKQQAIPLSNARGRISDAVGLGPNHILTVERRLTPFGFRNSLVLLERAGSAYRFGRRFALPLTPIDNVEAMVIERLPNGTRRLWLMTDNNFQPPLRTLLIALDMPALAERSPRS